MIEMEKRESNIPSTMKHIVRVDVGVIREEGRNHYFVNEVTRALEMSLFSRVKKDIDFIKIIGHITYDSIKELIQSTKE